MVQFFFTCSSHSPFIARQNHTFYNYRLEVYSYQASKTRLSIVMIPRFPHTAELNLIQRQTIHPLLQQLPDGISEYTFANLYLFRKTHRYRVTQIKSGQIMIMGEDNQKSFFMSPFGLPAPDILQTFFDEFKSMKCVPESDVAPLTELGYEVSEDRDNYDYLYSRQDLAELTGRKFSKKRNLIKAFINNFDYVGKPLLEEHIPDALEVLDQWRSERDMPGDYEAAREALENCETLQLCGGIYYTGDRPVAYSLGEELMQGRSFVIHFEKAVSGYKGLWQFINQAFASILPDKYDTINREQDLGVDGLRAAKMSYKPIGFVKKYKAVKK